MARIGSQQIADQLAKAVGQAGGEAAKSGGKEAASAGWVVPKLGDFSLDDALGQAYNKAAGYLNFMLASEGLVLDLQQGDGQTTALVKENGGARQYRSYAGPDMLKLYANQHGGRGVVADGQV